MFTYIILSLVNFSSFSVYFNYYFIFTNLVYNIVILICLFILIFNMIQIMVHNYRIIVYIYNVILLKFCTRFRVINF